MPESNQDLHQDRQLEKHLEGDNSDLSNCCEAIIYENSDVCSDCKEHCVTISEELEQLRDSETNDRIEEGKEK